MRFSLPLSAGAPGKPKSGGPPTTHEDAAYLGRTVLKLSVCGKWTKTSASG